MKKKQLENRIDYLTIAVIGLVALLALNYIGDFTYRGAVNEHIDNSNYNFQVMVNVSNSHLDKLNEMDKDIRSNMKVVDQLIGIILRDEI